MLAKSSPTCTKWYYLRLCHYQTLVAYVLNFSLIYILSIILFLLAGSFLQSYSFSEWRTISGACSLVCCLNKGVIRQGRSCNTNITRDGSCVGVLFKREFSCSDYCTCKFGMMFHIFSLRYMICT